MRDSGTYTCGGACSVSTAPSNALCPGGGGGGTPPPGGGGGGGGGTPPPGGGGSTPDLQVVCDVLDYGTLPIFAPARTKSCHIQNIGGGILTGTFTLTPQSPPNNFTCSACGAFTLLPLGMKNINIVLDPTIPGQYQANVTAIADTGETYGPRTAQGVVAYDGSSVRYDFGNVRVKTPPIGVLSDWIVITNNNPHLDIGSGILTGLSAPFTCESGGCAYGTIPRNGGTTRVRIRFTPTAVMQFGNEPRLRVTAPGGLQAPADLIRIELTGRGVPDSTEFDEI